jgi:hypothetical protein
MFSRLLHLPSNPLSSLPRTPERPLTPDYLGRLALVSVGMSNNVIDGDGIGLAWPGSRTSHLRNDTGGIGIDDHVSKGVGLVPFCYCSDSRNFCVESSLVGG